MVGARLFPSVASCSHALPPSALDAQTPAAPKSDPLDRQDPRSSVTGFLLACRASDYRRASDYLDLRRLSMQARTERGTLLARDLETILNSAPDFNVLALSRSPEGDLADDADPTREHVVNVKQGSHTFSLDLERVALQPDRRPCGCLPAIPSPPFRS